MSTTFKYERIKDGIAVPLEELKREVEKTWPNHRTFIDKVLHGFGMEGWTIRFSPYRYRFWGSGAIASAIKLIVVESHTKDEMLTTILHEISHYRNPGVPEREIEERSVVWFKALQVQ